MGVLEGGVFAVPATVCRRKSDGGILHAICRRRHYKIAIGHGCCSKIARSGCRFCDSFKLRAAALKSL